MNEKKLVPRRRFEEFQNADAWEQREVIEMLRGTPGSIKIGPFGSALKKEYFVDSGVKVYAQENIFLRDFNVGNYYITEAKYRELQSCELFPGDLVISMMGTVGACAVFPDTAERGIMNSHLLRLQFNKKIIPEYIMFLLRDSLLIRKQINKLSVGSIMSGLSSSVVKQLVFPIPSIEEQGKLVSYFQKLDNLITLHQRNLEKTKALKSAYLAEMFPAEGERVPKRRFAGFTREWKELKLGELGYTFSGLSGKTKKDFGHGDAEYVPYMNVFKNEISNCMLTEKVVLDNKQKELKYGDVLFTTSSETPHEVGMSSVWLDNKPNVYLNSFCFGLRPTVSINNLFLAYLLRSNEVRRQIEILAQGISRYNISKGKVMEINIGIPQDEEQKAIGRFFEKLDDSIINQQQKLDKLKAMKQAYLQEMFV
ncbi:restriction endonuclease subunit S [Sporosarcina sp. Te-1]|uniref:restriction endonuclease subunit S n=1 Tax=Sporosarcina sp. Te-1 TaxID=2818390 RepID=UPI001A9D3402|nr:restriction endonuclease subunit S [Sporosarcina sp. Te-1]QTD39477.1 restriction endonuclease subunit S [Sporosarcina sp. Te-1]